MLLQRGIDVTIKNDKGKVALEDACYNNNQEAVRLITREYKYERYDVDTMLETYNLSCENGKSLSNLARINNNAQMENTINEKTVNLVLEKLLQTKNRKNKGLELI